MTAEPRRTFLKTLAGAALAAPLCQRLVAQERRKGKPIRIGQIGVGHPHAGKLAVFRQSPDYEVVGIVEPDAELRQRARSQPAFADLKWMTQDELLSSPGLEAVLVETRVRDLLSAAESCVAAGKHVHLDKPAGASLPHYRRLLESAAKQKLRSIRDCCI